MRYALLLLGNIFKKYPQWAFVALMSLFMTLGVVLLDRIQ
jgi:hypothetical protein